jgi:hypothetical protein
MTSINCVIGAALVMSGAMPAYAQQPATGAAVAVKAPATVAHATPPRLLPGTRIDVLTTIQGHALDSTNGQLPQTLVRLRDARIGRIVESQLTDKDGLFVFKALDPGSYIVEMMANDQSVLAASPLINVNAGEAASAVVKLPFHLPPFAGVLGNQSASAAAMMLTAAASGVLATTLSGQPVTPVR